jgi:Domain of unknown function (DUF4214)
MASGYPPGQTTTDFVTQVYGNVLGRDPDQGGLNYWVNSLQTGGVATASSRPIMRVTANGRLCSVLEGASGDGAASDASSRCTGATKL